METDEAHSQNINIAVDRFILLADNRDDIRILRICDHNGFRWRKIPLPIKKLAEYEYFQKLQLYNGELKVSDYSENEDDDPEGREQAQLGDNRDIYTLQQAQKLPPQEIQKMKKNLKGQQIITAIVSNNEQFAKRTAYSKEKYLKKKQKKYLFVLHAEPTCPENVHDYYFKSDPSSISAIRWDMLAFMLLHTGPFVGKRSLVLDKGKGLIAGILLYKGAKQITVIYKEQVSRASIMRKFPIIQQLNPTEQQKKSVTPTTFEDIIEKKTLHDNLIIMGNYDFSGIIQKLSPLLIDGAPVAFYCLHLEPLSQCYEKLLQMKYINVRIYDSWAREYQVLKNRTHPKMTMSSHSGYLLSAIKSSFNKL